MALPKLMLDINEAQYSVAAGLEINEVQVDSGPVWRRKDFFGAPNIVPLQFVTTETGYAYLMAFWRTTLERGLLPFLIDLVIDDASMTEYQVVILNRGALSSTRQGSTWFVSATLEAKRSATETVNDAAIVALYEQFGDYTDYAFDLLEHLANVTMPANLQ